MVFCYRAVCGGNKDIVNVLLDYRTNPNAICRLKSPENHEFEWTSIHEACRSKIKHKLFSVILIFHLHCFKSDRIIIELFMFTDVVTWRYY